MRPGFKSLKIEDVKALQGLIAEHLDAIQPGLTKLDASALLGGATIDLVALDAGQSLVLIAVGFVADEAMLLRALEGYSWCLEYPDGLQRLYPQARVSRENPPRVLFIAESVPDAFRRKIKHLRFQEVECFEFRVGVEFQPVGRVRGGESERPAAALEHAPRLSEPSPAAPAKSAEVPAVRVRDSRDGREGRETREVRVSHEAREMREPRETPDTRMIRELREARMSRDPRDAREGRGTKEPREVREVREPRDGREAREIRQAAEPRESSTPPPDAPREPVGVLEGLRLPENGELSPQWKKALTKVPGEIDDSKLRTVRAYLQREFPTAVLYDFYQADRQIFHLQDTHGNVVHLAAVAEDWLDEHPESQIRTYLEKHKLARVLRQAGQAAVVVSKGGLKVQRA